MTPVLIKGVAVNFCDQACGHPIAVGNLIQREGAQIVHVAADVCIEMDFCHCNAPLLSRSFLFYPTFTAFRTVHTRLLPLTKNTIVFYTQHMGHREHTKAIILDRAVQMASVQSLNGLTIGRLAEALSLSKGGICAHFPSKFALQLAVVEKAASMFRRAVVQPLFEEAPGLPQLQALSTAWFNYLAVGTFEGGCFFTNVMLEVDDLEQNEVREAVVQQYNRFIDLIEQCARDAITQGHFRPDLEVRQFAFEFIGIKLSAVMWRGLRREAHSVERAQRAIADLFERASS